MNKKSEEEKRTSNIKVLFTKAEKEKIEKLASVSTGGDRSKYIRGAIRLRTQSELGEILAMGQGEKSKGNFGQLTLDPIIESLQGVQDQINGLDENEEKEFYWELVEWLIDFMNDSKNRNLFNEHSYEIPDDHE